MIQIKKHYIFFILLVLFFSACDKTPEISRLSASSVVLCFGDSLTYGTGVERINSYPSVLSSILGCKVVNAGVPGEDTTEGLSRLPLVLAKERPDLVILCHGGNDMLRQQNMDITRENIDSMVTMIKEAGAEVILIGVPRPGLMLKYPAFYQDISENHSVPYEDESLAEIISSPSLKSDHVHPNGAGYRLLAESVANIINRSQAE